MNNVVPLKRVSFARSEQSVTSPMRPATPEKSSKRRDWRNSDTLHPIVPANVARIKNKTIAANTPIARPPKTPTPAPEKRPSKLKKAMALVGVLACSLGVVAGLVSIAAIGPLGLAAAGGSAAVGAALIFLARQ